METYQPIGPLFTGEPKDLAQLFAKVNAAMKSIDAVEKNGENRDIHYKYAADADVLQAARTAISNAGLAFFPSAVEVQRTPVDTQGKKPKTQTCVHFLMTMADIETGATFSCQWEGEAVDWDDKGTSKAIVSGIKYFLLKLFLIPTTDGDDDPDHRSPVSGQPARRAPASRPRQAPSRPASAPAGEGASGEKASQVTATMFWRAAQEYIGTGKRFATKDDALVYLKGFEGESGAHDFAAAIAGLAQA
jgi:hypothetical protein